MFVALTNDDAYYFIPDEEIAVAMADLFEIDFNRMAFNVFEAEDAIDMSHLHSGATLMKARAVLEETFAKNDVGFFADTAQLAITNLVKAGLTFHERIS